MPIRRGLPRQPSAVADGFGGADGAGRGSLYVAFTFLDDAYFL